jgi:hypothetical protein
MPEENTTEMVERARREIAQTAFGDARNREHLHAYFVIVAPILAELADIGYNLDTLDDLRHQGKPWKTALPVLLRWLPRIDDLSVKENVVRCLSVPWVGSTGTAELIKQFKRYAPVLRSCSNPWVGKQLRDPPAEERVLFPAFSLAWTIGNALSIVDVTGFERQVIELCTDPRCGDARQMVVLGLGRLRSPEAEEAAVELLYDEGVQLHAIIALGKMKSRRSLFELEKLLTHKRAAIRKDARSAITKIMREHK